MHDIATVSPDHRALFDIASEQMGYFTTEQARGCGFSKVMLTYHTQSGRFLRLRYGLYRLRDYPSSPREEVMEAWLTVGRDVAIVSHESALELLGLSDVIPNAIHLTIPRSKRYLRHPPGTKIHTTTSPPLSSDVTVRDGIRLTGVARTIFDAAEAGTAPEQVEMAVMQAITRGLTTLGRLEVEAERRSMRVKHMVSQAVDRLAP